MQCCSLQIKMVVVLLEMTVCPYKNVSLIFCFLKCCADILREICLRGLTELG